MSTDPTTHDVDNIVQTADLVAIARGTMSKNFRQAPVVLTRGEGLYVWDRTGRRYLDFIGGIAVNGLGHSHPRVIEATVRQVNQLVHVSNLYFNEPQIHLSQRLSQRFGDGRVFLCNSGTEANEAALKLARRYASLVKGEADRVGFVSFNNSFHGRTLGALAATGQPNYHEGFRPMIPGFRFADFNDIDSVAALVDETTCAVIVEPIQAEGGLILPAPGFLKALKSLCEERGALLILDEVQTGCGRTGTFFAYEHEGVKPDIVTLAKALGAGMPIGAMISTEEVSDGFAPGAHGSTFSGNAVACNVALAVLDCFVEEDLLAHVTRIGAFLGESLAQLAKTHELVEGARGRGLIWGLALTGDFAPELVAQCLDRGLLVNRLNARTVRFLPPLITQKSHVRAMCEILTEALEHVESAGVESTA